ncbi:hypothetical protein QUB05_18965 [Microcoleus sp. F10-C6]
MGNGEWEMGNWELGRVELFFFLLPSSDGHRTDIRYILYSARCRTSF